LYEKGSLFPVQKAQAEPLTLTAPVYPSHSAGLARPVRAWEVPSWRERRQRAEGGEATMADEPNETAESTRDKMPLNPSVRGTGKQSGRAAKGFKHPSLRKEGNGTPAGHGRGGKASRS
jgi:hypothetical protein